MAWLNRPDYRRMEWLPVLLAGILTAVGIAFIISATADPEGGWGREARQQIMWLAIALGACFTVVHIPLKVWSDHAGLLWLGAMGILVIMWGLAGTALVPPIKGQHNWLDLGPLRVQPSEFVKLGVLIATARFCAARDFDVSRLGHCVAALGVAGLPALFLAREDLGSGLTFLPMALGILIVAGMRLRHVSLVLGGLTAAVLTGVQLLPKEGPKAYQWERIQAWLDPERYALTTGFQTLRALRSIGSGQWLGKGYGEGDQNRLGWLPEKHTDMIFGVIGEEWGFVRTAPLLALYLAFGWSLLWAAASCRDGFARLLVVGFAALVMGQASINLAVVLGLMPVTGITLPFFSYGGSSLLAMYLGLGLVLAATGARLDHFSRSLSS